MENKEVKAENTAKPADPDDIYATLDWDTNPPINGFYEMMMGLTPERRKELRELARQHNEKQVAEKTEVKACLLYTSTIDTLFHNHTLRTGGKPKGRRT